MTAAAYDIIIIGGGFSGLMVAANVVRRSRKLLSIAWADDSGRFARGTAHATVESAHLLNVPAEKMGAWADDPGDFHNWLKNAHPLQEAQTFVPRLFYGEYLESIRNQAAAHAALHQLPVAAVGATYEDEIFTVRFADHSAAQARTLVIATGNPPSRNPDWPDNARYIADFWRWRLAGHRVPGVDFDANIVLVGAGLTAADAIMSLRRDGFSGNILAVSTHGWMPHPHATAAPADFTGLIGALKKTPNVRAALRHFRAALKSAPETWRAAVDALRPHTVALWQALDDREKSRFLRHLLSLWNVHRHRMAPQIENLLKADKKLTVMAGRVTGAASDGVVTIQPRGGGNPLTVVASKVINCTGPSYRNLIAGNPLLADLQRQRLIRPGPLGLGLATPDTPGLYVIGTPLTGERLETIAVPELRAQAAEIAEKILKNI